MGVVTDRTILNEIQYALIEAPDQGATVPSGLWTAAELLEALNLRQQRFVRATRVHVGRADIALGATVESLDLGAAGGFEDVQEIIHLELELAAGTFHEIPRSSTFSADHAIPTWSTAAGAQQIPEAYSTRDTPSLTIRLMPASSVGGTLWVHFIPRPWVLTQTPAETLMVQEELALGVKWATLGTLFGKPGRAQDLQKAQYAEARGQEIEELAIRLVEGF